MSTECKKQIAEIERQRDYYKEMYEMRTEAYIRLAQEFDTVRENLDMQLRSEKEGIKQLGWIAIQNASLR